MVMALQLLDVGPKVEGKFVGRKYESEHSQNFKVRSQERQMRDISTSGIFFETESAHSIGDTIRLFLNFAHETLQCDARVVRVEPRNGQFGVAVELTSYVFC
jgi:hypothetical protein